MSNRKLRLSDQRGFLHHVIPVLAFAALFAIFGTYLLLRPSRAAVPNYYIQPNALANDCLSNVTGFAMIEPCRTSDSAVTATVGTSKTLIKINNECLEVSGTVAIFQTSACQGKTAGDYWELATLANPILRPTSNTSTCLGGKGTGKPLSLQTYCTPITTAPPDDYTWTVAPAPGSGPVVSPPVVGTPSPGPKPVPVSSGPTIAQYYETAAQPCYEYSYSTANVKTAYYCVAAFQNMLNGMRSFDSTKTATLTIDGQFGTQTSQATKDYQNYENNSLTGTNRLSANGNAYPNTWKFLCWSMYNRKLTGSSTSTGKAYAYAECTTDGVAVGKKP